MFFEIRYFLPVDVSLKLFVCFFSPIWNCGLGFCICSHLTDILIVKENNLSYHLSKFFSLLSPIFSGLKILKLQELFQLKLLSFVYEYINKIFPVCFHTYFQSIKFIHQHGTRKASKNNIFLTQKNTLQYGMALDLFVSLVPPNFGIVFLQLLKNLYPCFAIN